MRVTVAGMVTLVMEDPKKAYGPILVTPLGIVTRPVHIVIIKLCTEPDCI